MYVDPDENWEPIEIYVTEDEIIAKYWEYWQAGMRDCKHKKQESEITRENCIDDFVVVHWATEVTRD